MYKSFNGIEELVIKEDAKKFLNNIIFVENLSIKLLRKFSRDFLFFLKNNFRYLDGFLKDLNKKETKLFVRQLDELMFVSEIASHSEVIASKKFKVLKRISKRSSRKSIKMIQNKIVSYFDKFTNNPNQFVTVNIFDIQKLIINFLLDDECKEEATVALLGARYILVCESNSNKKIEFENIFNLALFNLKIHKHTKFFQHLN